MSFQIGAVTLPRFPEKITFRKAADVKSYMMPGALPLLISFGGKADSIVVEGRLQLAGSTKAQIITNYIVPLEALVNTIVTITCTGRTWTGTNFVFVKFDYDERPGEVRSLYYRMEFWKGSDMTVL